MTYLVLAGPTGSGKSALALALAARLGAEIVGCDSVQLFKGFDIGAAKPTAAERAAVPHHMIDVAAWDASYDAARYASEAAAALTAIRARGRLPLVVGGTGLYLRALLGQGFHADLPSDPALRARLGTEDSRVLYSRLMAMDPGRATELHPNDRFRVIRSLELATLLGKPLREAGLDGGAPPDPQAIVVILEPDRADLHDRIQARTRAMLADGLLAEVQGLLAAGVPAEAKPMQSIGYRQAVAHLKGELSESLLPAAIDAATRQYAKRQGTWFKKVSAALRIAAPSPTAIDAVAAAVGWA